MEIEVVRGTSKPDGSTLAHLCSRDPGLRMDAERIPYAFEDATHVILAKEKGKIVAFACIDTSPETSTELMLLCGSYRDATGQKASTRLVQEVEKLARVNGHSVITLETVESDKVTKLYEELGFKPKGTGFRMEKTLTAGSRIKKQARGTQRNRRNLKRRKSRKFATRRR